MKKIIIGLLLVVFLVGNALALRLPYVPSERWIIIDSRITEFEAVNVITKIIDLDQKKGDIRVYIYSPGGDVKAGLVIIDAIKTAKNDIQVVGIGVVSSMATYIFASCTKGKRVLFEHSEVYIHEIFFSDEENLTEEDKLELEKEQSVLNLILIKNSKMKPEDIKKWNRRIMPAKKAIELGIADGLYEKEEDKE